MAGNDAFVNCPKLKRVHLPDGTTVVGERCFYKDESLEKIIFPESSLKVIGVESFLGCASLKEVVIPSTVIKIGIRAFKDCTSLESVVIKNPKCEICASAFHGCISLESVVIVSR